MLRLTHSRLHGPLASYPTSKSGGHAEFLARRQEEYQRTLCDLWVMYGRVTESAQENQLTQDLELLMQVMDSRLQSLAKLNSDFHYQGTTEEVKYYAEFTVIYS